MNDCIWAARILFSSSAVRPLLYLSVDYAAHSEPLLPVKWVPCLRAKICRGEILWHRERQRAFTTGMVCHEHVWPLLEKVCLNCFFQLHTTYICLRIESDRINKCFLQLRTNANLTESITAVLDDSFEHLLELQESVALAPIFILLIIIAGIVSWTILSKIWFFSCFP